MKSVVMAISVILIFQISPKMFANDKNSLEEGQPIYYIKTAEDFNNIRTTPGAIYILMNDINLGQYQNWKPISNFSGTLDGRGNTIEGLQIIKGLQTNEEFNNIGLFDKNTGIIQHLIVDGPGISCEGAMAGMTNIGVIAGKNIGLIEDVFVKDVKVDIKGKNAFLGTVVGGLVGENTGTIEYCHVTGKIKGKIVGGLVGKNWSNKNKSLGIIEESSFVGEVESNDCIGGLVGNNMGRIENCFSQTYLKVPSGEKVSRVGGVAGDNEGDVSYCYASLWIGDGDKRIQGKVSGVAPVRRDYIKGTLFYDKDTMGLTPNTESGEGKSTTQMKLKATYVETGWNFKSIWKIVDGENYPSLRQPASVLPDNPEDLENPGELDNPEDLETPEEPDNPGDLENPEESENLEDLETPEEPDNSEDLETPEEPDNSEDLETPEEPGNPEDLEPPEESDNSQGAGHIENKEDVKESKNQGQSSSARWEGPRLVDDEKRLASYFINSKDIAFKYLREVLVRRYLSKAASQILRPGKPVGILTWISKYHILNM